MCGRYTLHSRDRIKLKGAPTLDLPFEPRYNIAPSQTIATIVDFGRGPELHPMVWGLIPSWSNDGRASLTLGLKHWKGNLALGDSDPAAAGRLDGQFTFKHSSRKLPLSFTS